MGPLESIIVAMEICIVFFCVLSFFIIFIAPDWMLTTDAIKVKRGVFRLLGESKEES